MCTAFEVPPIVLYGTNRAGNLLQESKWVETKFSGPTRNYSLPNFAREPT